jgi:hypothetical protein
MIYEIRVTCTVITLIKVEVFTLLTTYSAWGGGESKQA